MRKGFRIPNLGERELNQLTSYNSIVGGMTGIYNLFKHLGKVGRSVGGIHSQNVLEAPIRGHSSFVSALLGARGHIGGITGQNFNSAINTMLQKIKSMGGIQIKANDLGKLLGDLEKRFEQLSHNLSGHEKAYIDELRRLAINARGKAESGGFAALGGSAREIQKTVFGANAANTAQKALEGLTNVFEDAKNAFDSKGLAHSVSLVRNEMVRAAADAKDARGKIKAAKSAKSMLDSLAETASGTDKANIKILSNELGRTIAHQEKSLRLGGQGIAGNLLSKRIERLTHGIGAATRYIEPLKHSLDIGNSIFQAVNSRINQIARTQMGISAERGGFGRQIRGAGINYGNMMAAIGAGRSAGMEDRQIISQMVGLQTQLAQARWGEGGLAENVGRWGISVYKGNGDVKQAHELMIDFSRTLRSLSTDMEKLQFLHAIGRRPEEMEYVANYERETKRWEAIKRNPRLQGTLESARILDESGMSAKIDAATKIELRRRQILNQNAWDEGLGQGLLRTMDPENWFFQDWTARQRGLEVAKSESAEQKLATELENLRRTLEKTDKDLVLSGKRATESSLSVKDLKALSFSSGRAMAEERNLGDKAASVIIRNAFTKGQSWTDNVQTQKKIEGTARGASLGMVAGFGGLALATLLTGGIAGLAALPAWLLGGAALLGGAVGGYAGYKTSDTAKPTFINSDLVKTTRVLAQGSDDEQWRKWKEQNYIGALTRKQALEEGFDAEAMEGAIAATAERNAELRTGKKVSWDSLSNDRFLKTLLSGAGSIKEKGKVIEDALVRGTNGGVATGKEAFQYMKLAGGFDPYSQESRAAIEAEARNLWDKPGNEKKSLADLREEATKKVRDKALDNLTPAEYRAAIDYIRNGASPEELVTEEEKKQGEFSLAALGDSYLGKQLKAGQSATELLRIHRGELEKKKKFTTIEHLENIARMQGAYADDSSREKVIQSLDNKLFGSGGAPLRYQATEEQMEAFRKFQRGRGSGLSLAGQIERFAMDHKIDPDALRGGLGIGKSPDEMTKEEKEEYDKSSAAQEAARELEEQQEKGRREALYEQASQEDYDKAEAAAFEGEKGKRDLFRQIQAKVENGKKVSEEERAVYDEGKEAIIDALDSQIAESPESTAQEAARAAEEAEEEADLDDFLQQQASMAAGVRGGPTLAAQSQLRKMKEMATQGASEETLIRHFGADRYAQYQKSLKKGGAAAATPEEGAIVSGYPVGTGAAAAQARDKISASVQQAEAAAATGNKATAASASATAAAREKAMNMDVDQSIVLNINGEFPIDKEGVKDGAKAGTRGFAEALAQYFANKSPMQGIT